MSKEPGLQCKTPSQRKKPNQNKHTPVMVWDEGDKFSLFFFLETGSHYVNQGIQVGFKLAIFLPQLPKC